jgi:hypothetical protein
VCIGQWTPSFVNGGHECLLATASCMADGGGAGLDAYHDRHVGQRNLNLVPAERDMGPLMAMLDRALPLGADLELLHGLKDLKPLLLAHHPNLAIASPLTVNPTIGFPVNDSTVHLGGVKAVAPGVNQFIPATVVGPKCGTLGLDTSLLDDPLVKVNTPVATPATQLLMQNLGVRDLKAGTLAAKLSENVAGGVGAGHVLRFQASKDGKLVGGYTLIIQS